MSFSTITPVFAAPRGEGLLARLWRVLRAHHTARRTRAALRDLSPRALDDVGLAAADIDRVARRLAGL